MPWGTPPGGTWETLLQARRRSMTQPGEPLSKAGWDSGLKSNAELTGEGDRNKLTGGTGRSQ